MKIEGEERKKKKGEQKRSEKMSRLFQGKSENIKI